MSTDTRKTPADHSQQPERIPELIVYGHSWLFYWWPVWAVGYAMAAIIWTHPVRAEIGDRQEVFHPSSNLGVVYTILLVLMILVTSSSVRGMVAAFILVCLAFVALLLAYLDWWRTVLSWLGDLTITMNLGFYLAFSTALLLLWLLTVFVFDRLSFWRIRPGQLTHEYVLGAVDQSYDTETMVFTKSQSDIFRHWILGLGAGDLKMATMGGRGMQATVQNVLFVGAKMGTIQRLIATKEVTQEA